MISARNYMARALTGAIGNDSKQRPIATVELELTSGPDAGKRITYRGLLSDADKARKYVKPCLKAAGWRGKDIDMLGQDIEAATPEVPIEIEHRAWEGKTFPSVKSIGERQAAP